LDQLIPISIVDKYTTATTTTTFHVFSIWDEFFELKQIIDINLINVLIEQKVILF